MASDIANATYIKLLRFLSLDFDIEKGSNLIIWQPAPEINTLLNFNKFKALKRFKLYTATKY